VVAYVRGALGTDEVDLDALPAEVLLMVDRIVRPGGAFHVQSATRQRDAVSRRDAAHAALLSSLTTVEHADCVWLANVRTPGHPTVQQPSHALVARIRECQERGYEHRGVPPVYVRAAFHGGASVGDGLFAMAPLRRGQLIMQFVGRVIRAKTATPSYLRVGRRYNYIIEARYMGMDVVIDPLDRNTGTHRESRSVAACINEPSAPFAVDGLARHIPSGRSVVVRTMGLPGEAVWVEFVDDDKPTEVAWHDLTSYGADDTHVANCMWYDFPVPLTDLYRKTRDVSPDAAVFQRTASHATVLTARTPKQLTRLCDGHANLSGVFHLPEPRVYDVHVDDVVILREELFLGLHRAGVVLTCDPWTVRFVLRDVCAWNLPHHTFAGRLEGSKTYVPFPNVYACADVPAGRELLSLYAEPLDTRGEGCTLGDEDIGVAWVESFRG
jgi:hypothetical protein